MYPSNLQSKIKLRKQFHVKQYKKRKKVLRNKFNLKIARLVYTGNYITLLKEILRDLKKKKELPCLQIKRLNIVKIAIFLRLTNRLSAIVIKNPSSSFVETDKLTPKFIQKCKEPRMNKTTLKKKNQSWKIYVSQF